MRGCRGGCDRDCDSDCDCEGPKGAAACEATGVDGASSGRSCEAARAACSSGSSAKMCRMLLRASGSSTMRGAEVVVVGLVESMAAEEDEEEAVTRGACRWCPRSVIQQRDYFTTIKTIYDGRVGRGGCGLMGCWVGLRWRSFVAARNDRIWSWAGVPLSGLRWRISRLHAIPNWAWILRGPLFFGKDTRLRQIINSSNIS
jgi:hypothetical protein